MTPTSLARKECANFLPDGGCMGAGCLDQPPQRERNKCLLRDGVQCSYFEGCVLPLMDIVTDDKKLVEMERAAREYRTYITEESYESERRSMDGRTDREPIQRQGVILGQSQDRERASLLSGGLGETSLHRQERDGMAGKTGKSERSGKSA